MFGQITLTDSAYTAPLVSEIFNKYYGSNLLFPSSYLPVQKTCNHAQQIYTPQSNIDSE